MDTEVRQILSELRSGLEALYGDRLRHLVLFGSQARGDAMPGWDSDVDVLVVLKGAVSHEREIEKTSHLIADLSLRHDMSISRVFMDEGEFLHRNGPLLRNIRREGVPA